MNSRLEWEMNMHKAIGAYATTEGGRFHQKAYDADELSHEIWAAIHRMCDTYPKPDPVMYDVAEDVFDRVHREYSEVSALILLGSSAFGGSLVRSLIRGMHADDFDYGVVVDRPIERDKRVEMNSMVQRNIEQIGYDNGLTYQLYVCPIVNPASCFTETVTSLSAAEKKLLYTSSTELGLHFAPSVPAEYNALYQDMLMQSLRDLGRTSTDVYEHSRDRLMDDQRAFRRLKGHHFHPDRNGNLCNHPAWPAVDHAIVWSSNIMTQKFEKELDRTRPLHL